MKRTKLWAVLALVFILSSLVAGGGPATAQPPAQPSGFRALSGASAATFQVPGDMKLEKTLRFERYGLTYERYQQYFGVAQVLGGQVTVYRGGSGSVATVIGAHYPSIAPRNAARLSPADAGSTAERDVGPGEQRQIDLMINPQSGRFFFKVETRAFDSRWVHWIDAENGGVLNKYDAIATDDGIGVKGDTKDMNGPDNSSTADDLTTYHSASGHGATGAHWDLFSKDNRQKTYDARNKTSLLYYVTDADNHWTTTGRTSPGQPALVDAQYYANVTDDYFQGRHSFNWVGCYPGGMQSVAHYSRNYNNAFWNGTYLVYGDGDGSTFRELSGGLDVVAHESTHGVTDCTSNLVYQNESGALNESFSDILANSAEFYATANGLDPTVAPDWQIGEDVYLPADAVPGFRNMADPQEDRDPDHYGERYTGTSDNGGVHTNSGIPNHAYYLLVNGGRNAGCDSVGSDGHTHTADCNVTVASIGLDKSERIFYLGFTGLNSSATMNNARDATVVQAFSLYPNDCPSVVDAWQAVGVGGSATCGGGSSNTAPVAANDSYSTNKDSVLTVEAPGVLANDTDANGDALTALLVTSTVNGVLALNVNGSFTYTPGTGFVGSDSFTYKANDGALNSNEASVSITVNAPPSGNANDMYVWDILFQSRVRGGSRHDERVSVTIRRDSDADGLTESADAVVAGASVSLEVRKLSNGTLVGSFSGTTDSSGVYPTNWMNSLANDTYRAEVIALTHSTYTWDQALDPTVNDADDDTDNLPEQDHRIPH